MSGRKQHHFWQTLQRGFGTQRKSNYTKVYVYQKDKPPFDTDTRNNGAERDFFDFSQGSGADELITNIENEIQNLVKHYQNGGPIEPEHSTVLSVLIAHLEIRTKFLRQSFAETTSILMKELNRWFSSPDIFKKMMKNYAQENFHELDRHLSKSVNDPRIRANLIEFFSENFDIFGTRAIEAASSDAKRSLSYVSENNYEIAKHSHIKTILKHPQNSIRKQRYLNLNYRIPPIHEKKQPQI